MADPELKKAFTELQIKIIDINQKVKTSESQIASLKRELTKSELTEKELKEIPSDVNTYLPIGRMFVLQSSENIYQHLSEKRTLAKEKIKKMEEQISYWKKGVKESEENIRDMVSQKMKKN